VLECYRELSNPSPDISPKFKADLSLNFKKSKSGIDFISGLWRPIWFLKPVAKPPCLAYPGNSIYLDACVILVYVGFLINRWSAWDYPNF
jgi:hypothetical protein